MRLLEILSSVGLAAIIAKATLLLAIGWCAALVLRRAPAVARHLVWLTVIAGVLLVPVVARVAPLNVPVLPGATSPVAPVKTTIPRPEATSIDVRDANPSAAVAGNTVPSSVSSTTPRARVPSLASIAIAVWLAIASMLLARIAFGMASVRRIIRRGQALHAAEWTTDLNAAAARINVDVVPQLIMSEQVEMAFAFDALSPAIVVPVSAREWSADRRQAVLLHELAHIRRRDLIGHTVASVACALYWFNPLVWAAARRLRVESELASDDVVLESGVRPSEYAQHLLDMVSSLPARAPRVALAMARPKEFEGRLVAILDRSKHRRALGKAQRGAMVGLLGLLTISIAAVAPVPRSRSAVPPAAPTAAATPSAPVTTASSTAENSAPRVRQPSNVPAVRDTSMALSAPELSDVAVATLLRYGTAGVINPLLMMLRDADSLGLTGKQADSIATLNRAYMVRLNAIWSPVAAFYASRARAGNESPLNAAFRRAPATSMDVLIGIVPDVIGLLTDQQRMKLPATISIYLDTENLREIGAGRRGGPGGVLLPDGGPFRGGGRRGGGGRGS